jgi:CHASE3 domain sensor protein
VADAATLNPVPSHQKTLDAKCEEYQNLTDDEQTELRDWKVIEWFRQSNSRVIKALRDHLLPKKEKGGPKSAQLRQLFMTSQMTCIINPRAESSAQTSRSTLSTTQH